MQTKNAIFLGMIFVWFPIEKFSSYDCEESSASDSPPQADWPLLLLCLYVKQSPACKEKLRVLTPMEPLFPQKG
jgi:hypothetical protein